MKVLKKPVAPEPNEDVIDVIVENMRYVMHCELKG